MPRKKKGRTKSTLEEEEVVTVEEEKEPVEVPDLVQIGEKAPEKFSEADFPQKGELLIGTCTKISPHGAYFIVEGFEKLGKTAGFVPISEVAKTFVKNIRKFVKEGQKSVFKVLRINPYRGEVDLSMRRVSDHQRRNALKIFKQEGRARTLLSQIKDQHKLDESEIEKASEAMYNKYGQLFVGFEVARDSGAKSLVEIGVDKKIAEIIAEVATKELERATVVLVGKVKCGFWIKDGLGTLKECLSQATNAAKENDALEITIQNISSPEYRVEVSAADWKAAERGWQAFQETFGKSANKNSPFILEFARI